MFCVGHYHRHFGLTGLRTRDEIGYTQQLSGAECA
jgi:hypothetical protein